MNRIRSRGQGMTEYIIIVALIAIAAIAVYTLFGKTVRSQVGGMAAELGGDSSAASAAIGAAKSAGGEAAVAGQADKGLSDYNK